jgi:hypothetical protein
MKVLDLNCHNQHQFEGWFASEDDFQGQLSRGLVECPVCASHQINKRLSAPRLNLATVRGETEPPKPEAIWLETVRKVIETSEDVGENFADEARKIHYGEAKERQIRGQASAEETQELLEEGIPVLPLLIPESLKGTLQ